MKKTLKYIVLTLIAVLGFFDLFGLMPNEIKFFENLESMTKWYFLFTAFFIFIYLDRYKKVTINKIKYYLNIGITWQEEHFFLGMSSNATTPKAKVHQFQIEGFNNSKKTIEQAKGYILSLKNNTKIPILISLSKTGHKKYSSVVDIPAKCQFQVQANIGMDFDDFYNDFGEFLFVVDYQDKTYRKKYDKKSIYKQYVDFKTVPNNTKPTFI